jgi:hypothetical protein
MSFNEGVLSVVVWPTYIGVAHGINGSVAEPIGHPDYERGQIAWTPVPDDRQVIGQARILCPPGTYTHFVYYLHPTQMRVVGFTRMDHPVVFTEATNVLDVGPIENHDLRLAAPDERTPR